MRYLNLTEHGDWERAREALLRTLRDDGVSEKELVKLAKRIIAEMTKKIYCAMDELKKEWEEEPAYRVWEVLRQESSLPFYVHLSGGSSPALAEAFAEETKMPVELAACTQSTNALGSALALQSFSSTLHLDTTAGRYRIEETGEQGRWTGSKRPNQEAVAFLREVMEKRAQEMGLTVTELVEDDFSFFPQVKDSWTVGQIVRGSMHMPVGVSGRVRSNGHE
jgi:hypothetical protein